MEDIETDETTILRSEGKFSKYRSVDIAPVMLAVVNGGNSNQILSKQSTVDYMQNTG